MSHLIKAVLLFVALASSVAWADDEVVMTPERIAELTRLLNSKNHPLPVIPVVVGQADSREQVVGLVAPSQRPTIFQISQPTGPSASFNRPLPLASAAKMRLPPPQESRGAKLVTIRGIGRWRARGRNARLGAVGSYS